MGESNFPPFKVSNIDLGKGNELIFIDFEDLSPELKNVIDLYFVTICEGNSGSQLNTVKKYLLKFLTDKKGQTLEIGAISEFFLHLYLNVSGYSPQFLYLNLEEGSIKKGFDGYYLNQDVQWIVESKSGYSKTNGITHKKKIDEAYKDLKDKLSGGANNNPWRNAYSHANNRDVNSTKNVRSTIKSYSDLYTNGTFQEIKDFNIIPGGTIVLDGNWIAPDYSAIEAEVRELIRNLEFKQIKVLCVTKKTIQLLWDYLENT
jgi:hypothetical protein